MDYVHMNFRAFIQRGGKPQEIAPWNSNLTNLHSPARGKSRDRVVDH